SGDEPGQMAARGRRGHAGEVRELLRGERGAAEQRGQDARPGRLAEEARHGREHVGITHVPTLVRRMAPSKTRQFGLDRSVTAGRRPRRIAILAMAAHTRSTEREDSMITLCIRYTLDANKLADFEAYAKSVAGPIERSGGKVAGYYVPTKFA